MILLDTCTLLWLTMDRAGLSETARKALARHAGNLWVSPITAFEIGQKAAAGKLQLPWAPSRWFPRAIELHHLQICALAADVALRATELPPLHRDPFDRILVATAQTLGCTLLTPDHKIRQYPKLKTLW